MFIEALTHRNLIVDWDLIDGGGPAFKPNLSWESRDLPPKLFISGLNQQ